MARRWCRFAGLGSFMTRSRLLAAMLIPVATLALGFGAGAWWGRAHPPASSTSSSISSAEADREVCAHVSRGPLGAAGDWQDPTVGAIAFNSASPYVRDAYGAAVAQQIPLGATPDQMQRVTSAWGHLADVCAAVKARP